MNENTLRKNILKGSIWTIVGQFISLFITLVANVWLARLLSPSEFGQLGVIMFFIAVANVLTEGGLSGALIRKPNATNEDYSTIFILNILLSVFCYLLIVGFAGSIADFYNDVTLKLPLIVASLVLIINAFQLVQNTKLMANMQYRRKSVYDIVSALFSAIVAIYLAYNGFGIWALVVLQITKVLIRGLLLWGFEGFYFKLIFDKKSFKELYGFGLNTTLSSVLTIGFDNVYQLVLGKMFSISQVGLYYQARKITDAMLNGVISISQGPVFAGLSKIENDDKYATSFGTLIKLLLISIGFVSTVLIFYSDVIVLLLLGAEWVGTTFYLKLLIVAAFFYMLDNFHRVTFKVYDKTKKILLLDIVKKMIQTMTILIAIYTESLFILLVGFIVTSFLGYLLNFYFANKVVDTHKKQELIFMFKTVLISSLLLVVGFLLRDMYCLENLQLLILLPILIFLYFLFSILFRLIKIDNYKIKLL